MYWENSDSLIINVQSQKDSNILKRNGSLAKWKMACVSLLVPVVLYWCSSQSMIIFMVPVDSENMQTLIRFKYHLKTQIKSILVELPYKVTWFIITTIKINPKNNNVVYNNHG